MNWLTQLLGGGESIATPIEAIGNVFDKLFTSTEEKLQAKAVLEKLAQKPGELQAEINKLEAQHRSRFVAGWRPFIGWVCGVSLGAYFIPQYLIAAYVWASIVLDPSRAITAPMPPFPATADGLFELTLALLGMGGIRMIEKLKGKAK